MPDVEVKSNERVSITIPADRDLTPATAVEFIAHRDALGNPDPVVLEAVLDEPVEGERRVASHRLTGSLTAGVWFLELQATFPDGQVVSFPRGGFTRLRVIGGGTPVDAPPPPEEQDVILDGGAP